MPPARKKPSAYARAGVDIALGNRVKSGLPALLRPTRRPEVLGAVGGFGGLFDARFKKFKHPVLVSSIDGVGTKLKIAALAGRHETIGVDLVNHCVNDIAVLGAEPLFFLDYIGTPRLDPARFRQLLRGLARACRGAGCALIGGETAQMPDVYHGDDYDIVGTIVGVVEKSKMIDGSRIRPGDVLVGFPSSGLHTNGYSLARNILFDKMRLRVGQPLPGTRVNLGDALLAPHVNYQPLLQRLSRHVTWKGLAHITGGGFPDNLPRILPAGTGAEILTGSWPRPPIFEFLEASSGIDPAELFHVFNMGIGMVGVVSPRDVPRIQARTQAWVIGRITKGNRRVRLVF